MVRSDGQLATPRKIAPLLRWCCTGMVRSDYGTAPLESILLNALRWCRNGTVRREAR